MKKHVGPAGTVLIIGAGGGVARAVLALLSRTRLGRSLAARIGELLLLDAEPVKGEILAGARELMPARIRSAPQLARVLDAYGVDQLVDLSSLDTVASARVCDAAGAAYLDTSIEHWPDAPPRPWLEQVRAALPPARPALGRTSALVGSGMNPGIVNALVFAGMEELARRAGVAPDPAALALHTVLVTEDDTTFEETLPPPGVFPMTWNPVLCLEELLLPEAIHAARGRIAGLGHAPAEAWYRARCGDRVIEGFVVPHEEVLTLAARLPDVELGFVYRLPPAARMALAAAPARRRPGDWRVHRMFPPHGTGQRGGDRVGVLLGSRRFGELWIGYDVDARAAAPFGTNATQLQVAAGVIAGWAQLGRRRGIHFVEDLDWREHLAHVEAILGPPIVVHDPRAEPLSLPARRVAARPQLELVRDRPAASLMPS